MPTTPPKSNFDLDLDFGNFWEDRICRMLEGEGSVEVKADKAWANTGNLAFEYLRKCAQSPDGYERTGIMSTKAYWWCNVLCSPKNPKEAAGIRIWRTNVIKKVLATLLKQGRAWVRQGIGDGGRTSIILVPIDNLSETSLNTYSVDKDIAKRRRDFQQNNHIAKGAIEAWTLLKE